MALRKELFFHAPVSRGVKAIKELGMKRKNPTQLVSGGVVTIATMLCLIVTSSPVAQAASVQSQITSHVGDKTFWDLFQQGGFMMWVMLGVSMFALSLMIESAVKLREKIIAPPGLFDQLKTLFGQGNYQEAWRVSTVQSCPLSRIVAAGLEVLGQGRDAVNEALSEHALKEAMMLKTRVNYLSVIGVVSPMLGLIGTVVGMIKAFQVIGHLTTQPTELAEAIGEVLVATAFGLFIAVPAFSSYYFFRNRAQAMIVLLQDKVTRLMRHVPYEELHGIRIGEDHPVELTSTPPITVSQCPNCGNAIVFGATPCPACGTVLQWT